jgi:hypothetical protein
MKKQEILNHNIYRTMQFCISELKASSARLAAANASFEEPTAQVDYLKWCIDKSDPNLLGLTLLDNIDVRLQNAEESIKSLANITLPSPDLGEMSQVQTILDNVTGYILPIFDLIPFPRIKQMIRTEARESIDEIVSASRNAITRINEQFSVAQVKLSKDISDIKVASEREKAELKRQQDLVASLQQTVADQQAKLSQDAQAKALEFDGLIIERKEQISNWSDIITNQGQEYVEKIKSFYQLAGDMTLSGRFFQASREENFSYWINLVASVSFFLLAIASVMYETWWANESIRRILADPLFVWLGKISLVIVCVIPASIFASEATRHRRSAIWYKTAGVRIATLKPYLEEVGGSYEAELGEIIKNFFVSDPGFDAKGGARGLPNLRSVESLLQQLEKIKSLFKT